MAIYSYLALDASGAEQRGQIDAMDPREVGQILRSQALFVVEVTEGVGGVRTGERFFRRVISALAALRSPGRYFPVSSSDLIYFFRQLALLLRSGHTVVQALDIDQALIRKKRLSSAVDRMATAIREGSSFSGALQVEKRIFSPLISNLIRSGEASGNLDIVLERLAQNLEKRVALRRQLSTAIVYPSIVVLLSVGVVWMLMSFVIPKYSQFFSARRLEMPSLMQGVIGLSDWLEIYGQAVMIIAGASIFLALVAYTTRKGKAVIDRALLWAPLISSSITLSAMAQFGVTMSMLLRSGMTVLDALRVSSGVTGNAAIASSILNSGESVLLGNSLTASLRQPHIPQFVEHMAAIGERSGELDRVLEEMGNFYDNQLEVSVKRMVTFIEPVLILIVGGIVGVIYYAIFQTVLRAATGGLPS